MELSIVFFFSSRRRHTRLQGDWSSDVCSSDLVLSPAKMGASSLVASDAAKVTLGAAGAGLVAVAIMTATLGSNNGIVLTAARGIGRASGRGRGEISVGAGSLKKKKKQ